MIELLLATNNLHKLQEMEAAIGTMVKFTGLKKAGIHIDIPEPYYSLEENALEKCRVIYSLTGKNCIGEDTGLEIDFLRGEPGVRSARFAGDDKSPSNNTLKVLTLLGNTPTRKARFRTIISLILDKRESLFEGICEGTISYAERGAGGFGYDNIFVPLNSEKTFAEMTMEEKNHYSHRRKACDKLVLFLQHGV